MSTPCSTATSTTWRFRRWDTHAPLRLVNVRDGCSARWFDENADAWRTRLVCIAAVSRKMPIRNGENTLSSSDVCSSRRRAIAGLRPSLTASTIHEHCGQSSTILSADDFSTQLTKYETLLPVSHSHLSSLERRRSCPVCRQSLYRRSLSYTRQTTGKTLLTIPCSHMAGEATDGTHRTSHLSTMQCVTAVVQSARNMPSFSHGSRNWRWIVTTSTLTVQSPTWVSHRNSLKGLSRCDLLTTHRESNVLFPEKQSVKVTRLRTRSSACWMTSHTHTCSFNGNLTDASSYNVK